MWQCPKVYALSQIEHSAYQRCAPRKKSGERNREKEIGKEIGIDAATFLAYSPIVSLYPLILEHYVL
jgi:hypothetical protein